MKKLVLVVIAVILAWAGTVSAENGLKIGYVNMRKALNECKAGKQAKETLEKSIKDKQDVLDKEKKTLEEMQADFEKKASLLSEKAKQEKQEEFQNKLQNYQKMLADAQKEINEKEAEVTKKIIEEMRKLIEEIGKKEGYSLIFEETEISVIYAKEGLDLTNRVIQEYDKKSK